MLVDNKTKAKRHLKTAAQSPISTEPPAPSILRLAALGGWGEIGMNCLALEQGNDILVIDCGISFPVSDLGIDVLHPRFDYLIERADRVRALVITHGHEDHIGAVPHLLSAIGEHLAVWAPPHALSLIEKRAAEHGFDVEALKLFECHVRQSFKVGSFEVEPIRVTHSIADACALAIRTVAGTMVHTGDFKLDPTPPDGELTDTERLAELGRSGVRLLLSDSTNIDSVGSAGSERSVGEALWEAIRGAKQLVVVGMFASNVQRLILLFELARRASRKIVLLGRSVQTHVQAAVAVGRLSFPSDLIVPPESALVLAPEQLLVIASGTQAERGSAMTRLAQGVHPFIKLGEGDVVVLSSRIIPGNDRPVFDMMASLLRLGVDLISWSSHRGIHVSGHAHREEQTRMIELLRPQSFVPVHGTVHHLVRHAELAKSLGVGDVLWAENGEVVELSAERPLEKVGWTPVGRVATAGGEPIGDSVLKERAQLGRAGVVAVAVLLDRKGGLAAPVAVTERGVLEPEDDDVPALAAKAAEQVIVQAAEGRSRMRDDELAEAVRLATRRTIEAETGRRPVVAVLLNRV